MSKFLNALGLALVLWSLTACQSGEKGVKTETQSATQTGQLSTAVKLAMNALEKSGGEVTPDMQKKYALLERDGQQFLKGSAKVSPLENAEQAITETGTLIETKNGEIWTLLIPVNRLSELAQVSNLSYLDLDTQSEITK